MSDDQRNKYIYRYLFYLAAVYTTGTSEKEEDIINFAATSERLGYKRKSDSAKKIHNFISGKISGESKEKPEDLTTGILVERLANVLKSLENDLKHPRRAIANSKPKKIGNNDIAELFVHLVNLSPDEKQKLGLTTTDETNLILQQTLVNLERYQSPHQRDAILKLYKTSIGLAQDNITDSSIFDSEEKLEKFIKSNTENYLNNLRLADWKEKGKKVEELCRKIKRHILRIEAQIGLGELKDLDTKISQRVECNHLSQGFIKRLVDSTIENNLIRESIPLYFQYITTQQLDPLPLYYPEPDNNYPDGLLNRDIYSFGITGDNTSLSSQYTYKVTISFNLKIEAKELDKIKRNLPKEASASLIQEGKNGLVFNVTSSGVGGQMSQILRVINRALLWDINCLRENYFPVAHDLVIHQDIIKNNIASPVWAHSLVQLCKTEYLQEALKKQKFYDECAYLDEISTGDYCGFNFLESVAKSAIQARLSAILKTQIDPNQYIRDLSQTIQQEEILKIAENYLTYYPFSLRAMESYLQTYLLDRCEGLASYGCMKALLLITRGYLQEGLYRKASGFLKKVKNELDSKVSKVLSGSTLAEYELCKANYFYFFNTKDTTDRTIFNLDNTERGTLVNESWNSLNKAESYIKTRLTKYWTIKETSQSIFHPHFIILAWINFIKAKLFLFFPSYATIKIGENDDLQNFHYARLYFLERARIYAAKNGNTVDYACYTAYQVFAYTMTGYLVNKKQSLKSNREVDFTKEICLKKAQKLRDNALICYAEFGKQCYYEIKEKSGISVNKIYGKYQVERLPLIQEENAERSQQVISQGWEDGILHIDMSLLHMKTLDDSNDLLQESIYLFGAKAAIILFARAIYELCSDDNMEKISSLKAKFRKAYRLFTYAWAIAEDGCDTVESETEDYDYKIIRPYLQPTYEKEELFPPEAESVRDLYPHRQSEIADLGKIFAIACHLLKLYLIDHIDEEKQSVINKINYLKEKLKKPSNPNSEDEDNDVQNEFNEHLAHYFVKINKSINDELIHAQKNKYIASTDGIKKVRQRIMTNFCDFL